MDISFPSVCVIYSIACVSHFLFQQKKTKTKQKVDILVTLLDVCAVCGPMHLSRFFVFISRACIRLEVFARYQIHFILVIFKGDQCGLSSSSKHSFVFFFFTLIRTVKVPHPFHPRCVLCFCKTHYFLCFVLFCFLVCNFFFFETSSLVLRYVLSSDTSASESQGFYHLLPFLFCSSPFE